MNKKSILELINQKCCCGQNNESSGCCYEEITLTEAQALVASNSLVENKLYKITGVHKNKVGQYELLYDDGTNSGTSIYLEAITNNKFSVQGHGEFYNLKYSETGYGEETRIGTQLETVGSNYITDTNLTTTGGGAGMLVNVTADGFGQLTSVVIANPGAGYNAGDLITIDGGGDSNATFYYVVGRNLYNIWDGNNPNNFNITGYSPGDVAYWGGYAWTNLTGNAGGALDILTLDSNWTKIDYSNTTHYIKVLDEIEYDFANDWIQRRTSGTIDIFFPYTYWHSSENNWGALSGGFTVSIHAISATQWGNPFRQDGNGLLWGVGLITANDAYVDSINFKGRVLLGVTANHYSVIYNQYCGYNTESRDLMLDNRSFLKDCIFNNEAKVYDLRLIGSSWMDTVTLTGPALVFSWVSILNHSWIQKGTEGSVFSDSYISEVILSNGSYLTDFSVEDSSYFSKVTFDNESYASGALLRSNLSHSSWDVLSYTPITLTDAMKSKLSFSGATPSLISASNILAETDSIYTANTIDIYFGVTFDGTAGKGQGGSLNIPYIHINTGWYIDSVTVTHSTAIVGGVASYITLGLDVDNASSGLDSTTGLITTIDPSNVVKYTTLPNTFTTNTRLLVAAVGGNDITSGTLYFQIYLKKGTN